jgi:hypothetical protein
LPGGAGECFAAMRAGDKDGGKSIKYIEAIQTCRRDRGTRQQCIGCGIAVKDLEYGDTVALVSGGFALVGSLISLFSGYLTRLPPDQKGSLFDVYVGLVEARVEATEILQDVEAYMRIEREDKYDKKLAEVFGKSNAVCRKVKVLLANLVKSGEVGRT